MNIYYTISVSFKGSELFRTDESSLTNIDEAEELFDTFLLKFPPKQGYTVSLSRHEKTSELVNVIRGVNPTES